VWIFPLMLLRNHPDDGGDFLGDPKKARRDPLEGTPPGGGPASLTGFRTGVSGEVGLP